MSISCADFRGAKGNIIINPQKVANKSIMMSYLEGVTFVGNYNRQTQNYDNPCFNNCYLVGADFTGINEQIEINPQKIMHRTMAMCKCNRITFTGSFDGIITNGTSFNNCKYINQNISSEVKTLSFV